MDLRDAGLFRELCHVGGEWVGADDGGVMEVTDPADGRIIGSVPAMTGIEAARAVDAALKALEPWRSSSPAERSTALSRWGQIMMENIEDLALIMTMEQGKPLAESRGEIAYAAGFLDWFSAEARRAYGDTLQAPAGGKWILVLKQPVGVAAAITPWNFPSAMITRKAGAALAAGCSMVVRPASSTPFSALALCELAERAGIPPGVFNVVTGPADAVGGTLVRDPRVRKISFTGSTEVGSRLMALAAGDVKRVSLELGGNAPFIVFDDADIQRAVDNAVASKYRNTGQTCVCTNRFLVQDGIHEEFLEKLCSAVAGLRVGRGTDPGVQQGPLMDTAAVEKVRRHIADAVDKGARILMGGGPHELGGNFFQPTVLADVTPDMEIAMEETFGPVSAVMRFGTEGEALAMANDTRYGLAAYVHTRDLGRAWRCAGALEYGMVGINEGVISDPAAPFGGVKSSGSGREGSRYGMDEYMEIKYVCLGGLRE